jgi:hypothetical protein
MNERMQKKERERKKREIDEQSLAPSPSFLLKWTTEKWAVDDDDDQPTSEANGSFFVSLQTYLTMNRKGTKKRRVISFTK